MSLKTYEAAGTVGTFPSHIRTRAHTPNTDNALDIRLARLFTFFVGLLGIILPLTFWSLITMSTKKAICSSLENLTTLAA